MIAAISGTDGIVAVAASGVAALALLACIVLALALRRLRRAQRMVLGGRDERDVIEHAAGMEDAFATLHADVEDATRRTDERLAGVEAALRGTIAHRALVMRNGEVCEEGETDTLFTAAQHPYTKELLAAIPELHGAGA